MGDNNNVINCNVFALSIIIIVATIFINYHSKQQLTSFSVSFAITKNPFAVNFIFVVINCMLKHRNCSINATQFDAEPLHDSLCNSRGIFSYSFTARMQEQKTPISDVSGCMHRRQAADVKFNFFHHHKK
jgi:hypothetical protein